jgi:hypothetical protein
MNKSFHYYCIRVLAEKAGFEPENAQTIAFASQYTDDSTEFGKITITNIPDDFEYPRLNRSKNEFDPICTAHSAMSWFSRLWKWAKFYLKTDVQRKVLMPFHFLPPETLSSGNSDQFDFITKPNSPLANLIVDDALTCLSQAAAATHEYSLIKLGIALHTYADTWSHDGFSGRHNSLENDIKRIQKKKGNKYQAANPLEFTVSYAAPDVGHAEAGGLPDESSIDWKAKYAKKQGGLQRSNAESFLTAASQIYTRLSSVAAGRAIDWGSLSDKIFRCLECNGGWENEFKDIDFNYSRFTWRSAALAGDEVTWDSFDDERDFKKLHFQFTGGDMRWLLFHKAAHEQRETLKSKIPNTWLNS